MVSIQAVCGLPCLRASGIVPCIISFLQATPLFPHGVTIVCCGHTMASEKFNTSNSAATEQAGVCMSLHVMSDSVLSVIVSFAPTPSQLIISTTITQASIAVNMNIYMLLAGGVDQSDDDGGGRGG